MEYPIVITRKSTVTCFRSHMSQIELVLDPIYVSHRTVHLSRFSQLYMVTILKRRQEERNATRIKMLQKTYIYIEREERKYCPCKQLVCGKLIRKRRPFNSLYFLCPFGWVEENRALFLVLQLLEKSSQACIGV